MYYTRDQGMTGGNNVISIETANSVDQCRTNCVALPECVAFETREYTSNYECRYYAEGGIQKSATAENVILWTQICDGKSDDSVNR